MNGDAVVISRSVINPNNHQRKRNFISSSSRPSRTLIERNGKQFLTEFRERAERRYVQCFDESTQQMRFFEVIDYIPCRTIRPYKHKYQFLLQNNAFQNTSLPPLQSKQQPIPSQTFNGWSNHRPVFPSDNRVNLASDYSSQHNNGNVPSSDRNSKNLHYVASTVRLPPQSTLFSQSTKTTAAHPLDHYSKYSQPSPSQSLAMGSKNVSDQYSSKVSPFRAHTPTISEGRASSSTVESFGK
jgi:hypothetical protein